MTSVLLLLTRPLVGKGMCAVLGVNVVIRRFSACTDTYQRSVIGFHQLGYLSQ
jgi:hypothetical protein